MGAEKGNQYYLLRSKDGRDRIFKTPEELAEKANEYFNWCLDNPLYEIDFKGKDAIQVKIPKMRPFTIEGLCNFIDISVKSLYNYEAKKDFLQIVTRIRQIIYNQKFEGAASGFLNPNIIARDLGLKDRSDVTTDDKQITTINLEVVEAKHKGK